MELLTSILIVDDHSGSAKALRDVVASVLRDLGRDGPHRTGPHIAIAPSLAEATLMMLSRDLAARPRVIFLDLSLEGEATPSEVLNRIRIAALTDARILIWSGAPYTDADLERAWRDGASGWIPKGLSLEDLTEAVRSALELGFYLPDETAPAPVRVAHAADILSLEERRLARLVALDLDLQSIADTVTRGSLAEASSKVAVLCGKLGVISLPEAAARVRALGLQ